MSDDEQAQFDDAADALLRSLWPELTPVGAMVFGDTGAVELRASSDGTVRAVIYPPGDDAEFDDDTGDAIPSQVVVMSPAQAREVSAMFSHAADHVENVPGKVGWTEPCIEPES